LAVAAGGIGLQERPMSRAIRENPVTRPRGCVCCDPVPFFELVPPPRAAKAAVPILAFLSIAGFLAVALRRPIRSS